MESMTTRLDGHRFTARHSAGNTPPAPVLDYSRLAYGQTTAANFFPNGAQKYQMWGFMPEAPQAGIGGSLAEIAKIAKTPGALHVRQQSLVGGLHLDVAARCGLQRRQAALARHARRHLGARL